MGQYGQPYPSYGHGDPRGGYGMGPMEGSHPGMMPGYMPPNYGPGPYPGGASYPGADYANISPSQNQSQGRSGTTAADPAASGGPMKGNYHPSRIVTSFLD